MIAFYKGIYCFFKYKCGKKKRGGRGGGGGKEGCIAVKGFALFFSGILIRLWDFFERQTINVIFKVGVMVIAAAMVVIVDFVAVHTVPAPDQVVLLEGVLVLESMLRVG